MCLQVLEQWDAAQGQGGGQGSPQTSLSAPVVPHNAPFLTRHLHRASVPDSALPEGFDLSRPDPYDLYEKSRAIYESSRRKYWKHTSTTTTTTTAPSYLSGVPGVNVLLNRWTYEDTHSYTHTSSPE